MPTTQDDFDFQALLEQQGQGYDMSYLLEPFEIPSDGCIDPQLTLLNNDHGTGLAQQTSAYSVDAERSIAVPEDRDITGPGRPDKEVSLECLKCLARQEAPPLAPLPRQMTAISLVRGRLHNTTSLTSRNEAEHIDVNEAYPLGVHARGDVHLVNGQHDRVYQDSNIPHLVDQGVFASHEQGRHVKYEGLKCCAIDCQFGHDKPRPMRKDKLTQHIRDVHQGPNTRFQCFVAGCDSNDLSLKEFIVHLQDAGLRDDVRFSALLAAAEKPKCVCGNGLVIHGECKACHFKQTWV